MANCPASKLTSRSTIVAVAQRPSSIVQVISTRRSTGGFASMSAYTALDAASTSDKAGTSLELGCRRRCRLLLIIIELFRDRALRQGAMGLLTEPQTGYQTVLRTPDKTLIAFDYLRIRQLMVRAKRYKGSDQNERQDRPSMGFALKTCTSAVIFFSFQIVLDPQRGCSPSRCGNVTATYIGVAI